MTTDVPPAAVAAATAYEKLHVPALFGQWPPRLTRLARLRPGDHVLDVACGTGVLAREAARAVKDDGLVAGIDADPGMLAVARELAPSIEWSQGMAEALPYDDASFDVVVSQFGLMFFRDRVGALTEMLRVLVPGGRMAVAVWEALDRSQAYPIEVDVLQRIAGTDAADALRAPFVLGDPADLRKLFEKAGATSIGVFTEHGTARFPSIRTMVEADLRGWLPIMGVRLSETQIAEVLSQAERELSHFVTLAGTVEFDAPAHIVTAGRP